MDMNSKLNLAAKSAFILIVSCSFLLRAHGATGPVIGDNNHPNAGAVAATNRVENIVFKTKNLRACAGAIAAPNSRGHNPHQIPIKIQALDAAKKGTNGAIVTFSFEFTDAKGGTINYTNRTPPKFITPGTGLPVDTIDVTTSNDGTNDGIALATVRSSDVISSPKVVVTRIKNTVPNSWSAQCEFAAAQTIRRFGVKKLNSGYGTPANVLDNGWDYSPVALNDEGDFTTATLYLKFQVDKTVAIDQKYFLVPDTAHPGQKKKAASIDTGDDEGGAPDKYISGAEYNSAEIRENDSHPAGDPHLLDDAANWEPVNSHRILCRVSRIVGVSGQTIPAAEFSEYVLFVNDNDVPIKADGTVQTATPYTLPASVPVTGNATDAGGAAHVRLKAGKMIYNCSSIELQVVDKDQLLGTGVDITSGW